MKHFVAIDDHDQTGKDLTMLIRTLSGKGNGIDLITDTEEDKELMSLIKSGVKSGLANKNSVLRKLGLQ